MEFNIKRIKYHTLAEINEALDCMKKFKKNWNGYDAEPIPDDVIENVRLLSILLPFQMDIYPTGRKSIDMQIELENSSYLGFEVAKDMIGICIVHKRQYNQAIEKNLKYEKIQDIILKLSDIEIEFLKNKGDVTNVNLNL